MRDSHRTWKLFLFKLNVLAPFGRKLDRMLTLSVSFNPQNFRAGGWGSSCVRMQQIIMGIPSPSGLRHQIFRNQAMSSHLWENVWLRGITNVQENTPALPVLSRKKRLSQRLFFMGERSKKTRRPILKCRTPATQPQGHGRSWAFQNLLTSNKTTRDIA